MKRLISALAAPALAVVLLAAVPAWAYFDAQSSASQTGTALTVPPGSTPSGVVSGRDVTITWPITTVAGATPTYSLQRFSNGSSTADTTWSSACAAASLPGSSCTDQSVGQGAYAYAVTPHLSLWNGVSSAVSGSASVLGPTLALAAASTTADGGTLTAAVANYLDGEVVTFCLDYRAGPCATSLGQVTIPASGGSASNITLTVPAGTSVGTHPVYAVGSSSSSSVQSITVSVGAAAKLAFDTQPAGAAAGTVFTTQPAVLIEDKSGNLITSSTAAVTADVSTNIYGGTLSGCAATTTSGRATFSNCRIDKAGSGYTLIARSTSLTSATSSAFTVNGLAGLGLTNVQSTDHKSSTPLTLVCDAVSSARTCSASIANGGPRIVTFAVQVANADGTATGNPDSSSDTVTFTVDSGTATADSAIAAQATTSSPASEYTVAAGKTTGTITVHARVAGTDYQLAFTITPP